VSKLKVLDLFSGIGGFSLGLEETDGFETVAFCEINPDRRADLARMWPGIPIFDDVRAIEREDVEHVDVITGGFPCQDISIAGRRAGISGERSGLFAEIVRLLREFRPAIAILENSADLLVGERGAWPRSGMMRSGMSYQLPDLVPRTTENVSGSLLPTPVVGSKEGHHFLDGGSRARKKLRQLLPTITVNGNYNRVGASPTSGEGLYTTLNALGLKPGTISSQRFAAWMMGFPLDWPNKRPSASATP
jgi:hypothetical protein